MEPKNKLPLSFYNTPKNLFPKTHSFTENKKYLSNERHKKSIDSTTSSKQIKSFIYFHKIPVKENIKDPTLKEKSETRIDSRTEARLPPGYIDLSFDNNKNE